MNHGYYQSDGWKNYVNEVKLRVRGNWDAVAETVAPDLRPHLDRIGRHGPCPRHGGTDGFRLFKDFRETGGGICNTCGHFPDGFALLQWLYGWTFTQAIRAVGDALGVQDQTRRDGKVYAPKIKAPLVEYKRESPEEVARKDEYKAKRLTETWSGSFPITYPQAEPVRLYLRNRGITEAMGPLTDLQAHPNLEYREKDVVVGHWPALVGLMRSPDGSPCTIQRQWVTHEGTKAPVEEPRKIMPRRSTSRYNGSAVRLDHDVDALLLVSEGIETALAVRAMMGMPTWATCVAGLLEQLEVPETVQIVVVFGDKDRPSGINADGTYKYPKGRGYGAATALVERMKAMGKQATACFPPFDIPANAPKGIDWLDVLKAFGLEAARQNPYIAGARASIFAMADQLRIPRERLRVHY